MASTITVKQLNLYIKSLLEGDKKLAYISVKGEISNFKHHISSGHLYFTLKDESSTLKCVMFRGNASRLKFMPIEGMQVICTGSVSAYERDGIYQLYVESILPDGDGDLMAKLEKLKSKLEAEGLFDKDKKKNIPKFPKKIAVITSETGAAVRDIFNILGRRYPLASIIFCPATVQGELAPDSLCEALSMIEKTDADVIIIGRGGGSIEDLWCFNDEKLARKIASVNIPVISAVGHETDFTICDFVADLRAPTPSAAAELAVPDSDELLLSVLTSKSFFDKSINNLLMRRETDLNKVLSNKFFSNPAENICDKPSLALEGLIRRLHQTIDKDMLVKENLLYNGIATLDALSPVKTMLRGFTVAQIDNQVVKSTSQIKKGDELTLSFHDGKAFCTVNDIIKEQNDV